MENGVGRKRGVKASRVKLDKAMIAAGFKTQASLAEHIATLEALESPPKDMVNRAFRQLAVDPKSLERIARALNVEAYALYLSSSEPATRDAASAIQSGVENRNKTTGLTKWLFALLVGVSITIFIGFAARQHGSSLVSPSPSVIPDNHGPITFAIYPGEDGILKDVEVALTDKLRGSYQLVEHWSVQQVEGVDTLDLPARLNTDYVITSKIEQAERHSQVVFYLVGKEQRRTVFLDVLLTASIGQNAEKLAVSVMTSLENALSGASYVPEPGQTMNEEATEQFLLGQQYLNRENTDANLQRALARFERALRLAPEYGRAHGALCETLLRQASLSGDTTQLEDTRPVCMRALTYGDFEESLYGMTSLARRDRNWQQAEEYIERLLVVNPAYTDALFSKLKILETRAQLERNPELFKQGLEVAEQGISIEPDSWRGYFLKSRLLYFSGKVNEAIEALEISKIKQANFNNLNNLGTMYFCTGDLQSAKDNFLAILELQTDPSWIIEHQLASLYSFLGDGNNAIKYADRGMARLSIEEIDGHFDPWITKAIAYDTHGDAHTAKDSFAKALEVAERFRVSGKDEGNTLAQLIYIKTAMAYLDNNPIEGIQKTALVEQLNDAAAGATNPNALTRVMMAWVMLGELQNAKPIYDRMAAMCPGFVKQPILDPLREI